MPLKVWLAGEQLDLQRLAALFSDGDVRVVPDNDEDGRYYLTAVGLDQAHEENRVYPTVQLLLGWINGAAKVETPDFDDVTYAGRYTTANGDQVIQPTAAVLRLRVGMTATAVVRGPDGEVKPSPQPPAVTRVALAASNDQVAKVLTLMAGDRNWDDLWKVYETIRKAVGGTNALVNQLQWITEGDKEAFRESANNPDVSGDDARHAIPTSPTPPTRTMTIDEGRAFINDLIAKWTDWVIADP
jgi:hypothetical protein